MDIKAILYHCRRLIIRHPWRTAILVLFISSFVDRHFSAHQGIHAPPPINQTAGSIAIPPTLTAEPAPSSSASSSADATKLSFSPKQTAFARRSVADLTRKSFLSINLSPPLGTIVYVEPKLWSSMPHKEKAAFTEMLLAYFSDHNKSYPAKDQVYCFAVYNMTSRHRIAKAYLISLSPDIPPGHIQIFD